MSSGMALALRATTGMCAVLASSRKIFSASKPLISGRLISIRITFGSRLRASSMPIAPDKAGILELGEDQVNAALLRLQFDHGLAFGHDFGERQRFMRHREFPGLDQREMASMLDSMSDRV